MKESMINVLLLDLDGTVLDIDMDSFLREYMGALAQKFSFLLPTKEFITRIWEATVAMTGNLDPGVTNREAFNARFFPVAGRSEEELEPLFYEFYRDDFPRFGYLTRQMPGARECLEAALAAGWELVIATDPLFPRIAIEERLRWAGVSDLPFRLVTSYENMHFCKPHVQYFQEILTRIDRRPEQSLMVGNDLIQDFGCRKLGIKTFLLDQGRVIGERETFQPDFAGTFADLLELVKYGPLNANPPANGRAFPLQARQLDK